MPPRFVPIAAPGAVGAKKPKRPSLQPRAGHGPRSIQSDLFARPSAVRSHPKRRRQRRGVDRVCEAIDRRRQARNLLDRGPARNARKTRAFVKGLKRKSRLFYLPPYAPDRDPGERVWKHPKAATAGRMVFTGRACFQREVRPPLRHLQNDPGEIISFFPKRSLQYAA